METTRALTPAFSSKATMHVACEPQRVLPITLTHLTGLRLSGRLR